MTNMNETVTDAAEAANSGIKRAAKAGRRELSSFFDDVEELISRVPEMGDIDMARLRSKVEGSLRDARAAAGRGARRVQESVSGAATATDDYVHERPWTAIGAAALIGLAVGVALQRR